MKNLKKSLRYSLYLLLVKCVFCVGLQAQDAVNVRMSALDSIIMQLDTIQINYVSLIDLIDEYESGLGFEKRAIPCGCEPCAAYCYEEVPRQPNYYEFKQWLKDY